MSEQQQSMRSLSRILAAAEAFKQTIIEEETVRIRQVEFCQQLSSLMRHYTDEHTRWLQQRTQTLMTKFLQPKPAPADEPQPGPSSESQLVSESDFDGFLGQVNAYQALQQASSVSLPEPGAGSEDSD